jgi:hypothetical protein
MRFVGRQVLAGLRDMRKIVPVAGAPRESSVAPGRVSGEVEGQSGIQKPFPLDRVFYVRLGWCANLASRNLSHKRRQVGQS